MEEKKKRSNNKQIVIFGGLLLILIVLKLFVVFQSSSEADYNYYQKEDIKEKETKMFVGNSQSINSTEELEFAIEFQSSILDIMAIVIFLTFPIVLFTIFFNMFSRGRGLI